MASLRQFHQEVAFLKRKARKALGFVAHHERDFAVKRRIPHRMLGFFACASNPEASFLQTVDGRSEVGSLRATHVINGTRRAFVRRRRHACRAFARNNETARANNVNRTRDGAKVARIGNVIEQEFTTANNWYGGAGLSIVLMILILGSMAVMSHFDKEGEGAAIW